MKPKTASQTFTARLHPPTRSLIERHIAAAGKGHGNHCFKRDNGGDPNPCPNVNCSTKHLCPCCGYTEHHGSFCSNCGLWTGQKDWLPPDPAKSERMKKVMDERWHGKTTV